MSRSYVNGIMKKLVQFLYENGAKPPDNITQEDQLFTEILDEIQQSAQDLASDTISILMILCDDIKEEHGQMCYQSLRKLLIRDCQDDRKIKLTEISEKRTIEMVDTFLSGKSMWDFFTFILADRIKSNPKKFVDSITWSLYGNHTAP